jgi:hypothetical protein
MLTLKFEQINDRTFSDAMNKIDAHTGFSAKTLFDWNKMKDKWDREAKRGAEMFSKLLDKHTNKDEAGKPKHDKATGKFDFINEADFQKDCDEMLKQTFEIKASKLPIAELLNVKLSAREIRTLAPIIDGDIGVDLEDKLNEEEK